MERGDGPREVDAFHAAARRAGQIGIRRAAPRIDAAAGDGLGDRVDVVDLARPHRRQTDLELGHAERGQRARDLKFLLAREGDAGGLLAVAQRRIDEPEASAHAQPVPVPPQAVPRLQPVKRRLSVAGTGRPA